MPQLPTTSPKKVLKALQRAGFYIDRIVGSHHHLMHPDNPDLKVTVPFHGRDLKRGTVASIIKQTGMTVEKFIDLL